MEFSVTDIAVVQAAAQAAASSNESSSSDTEVVLPLVAVPADCEMEAEPETSSVQRTLPIPADCEMEAEPETSSIQRILEIQADWLAAMQVGNFEAAGDTVRGEYSLAKRSWLELRDPRPLVWVITVLNLMHKARAATAAPLFAVDSVKRRYAPLWERRLQVLCQGVLDTHSASFQGTRQWLRLDEDGDLIPEDEPTLQGG